MAGLLAILVAFAVTLHAAPSAAAPSKPATTTQLGQAYQLTATLDVAAGRIRVLERVTITNRAPYAIDHVNLSILPRAFGYFAFTGRVRAAGAVVPTRWTTGTNLRVSLGRRLGHGQSLTISVPFRLTIGSSGGAFTARTSRDRGVICSASGSRSCRDRMTATVSGDPQVTRTADQIRLELTTWTPLSRFAVACPGMVQAPAVRGRHWTCVSDQVRDFCFVVNPRFHLTRRTVDGVQLRIYTESVDGTVTANKARSAMARLNDLYGKYPWPDLVLAEVGADDGFSMEYPRAIHLTRSKVSDSYVVNHEVAHQWFYAQLGNDQMREPWLDEGFADFTARWLMGIGENQCSGREVDSPVFAWPAGRISGGDWQSCDGYFHTVFYKGTEFLNAVRTRMGTQAFFAAMRDYIASHRHRVITTRGLLDYLDGRTAANLRPLYVSYLNAYDP